MTSPDPLLLLSAKFVLSRWKAGSDSSLRRAENAGLLTARRLGRTRAFTWPAIWAFEGGQPPQGFEEAYRAELLTREEISLLCPLSPARIARLARCGDLPGRQVFGKLRFAPAEVKAWLEAQ